MTAVAFISTIRKMRRGKVPPCSVVIAAGGVSSRMDGEDKQFIDIQGVPVLAHALLAFQKCGYIKEIVVVTRSENIDRVAGICKEYGIQKASKVIAGGETRLASVMNGALAVSKKSALIAIHDGARPCVSQAVIEQAIEAAAKFNATAPAVQSASTVKKAKKGIVIETLDREEIYEIQTPQVFDADLIKAALTNALNKSLDITDDCAAVELLGATVHLTEGSRYNIKITTGEDVTIAAAIISGGISGCPLSC